MTTPDPIPEPAATDVDDEEDVDILVALQDVKAWFTEEKCPEAAEVIQEAADAIVSLREQLAQIQELGTGEANSLRSQLTKAREAALEDAAKLCDEEYNEQARLSTFHHGEGNYEAMDRRNAAAVAVSRIAAQIRRARSLLGKES